MKKKVFYIIACMISSCLLSAQISLSEEILVKGTPVKIMLKNPVDTVIVNYRPNSQVTKTIYLIGKKGTTFDWIPESAGVVALQAGDQSTTVSVRFPGASKSGIAIMLLAAVILFGGATFAFRLLMHGKPVESIELDPEHMPDT